MTGGSAGRGPWGWLPQSHDEAVLAIGLGLVLVVGFAMDTAGYRMRTTDVAGRRGPGIVPLELAWSAKRVRELVTRWGTAGVAAARASIAWDFGWLVAYGATLSLAGAMIAARTSGWQSTVALVVCWVALVAAACDAVEDAFMLIALRDLNGSAARYATIAATAKWLLLGAAVPTLAALALARWAAVTVPVATAVGLMATGRWLQRARP